MKPMRGRTPQAPSRPTSARPRTCSRRRGGRMAAFRAGRHGIGVRARPRSRAADPGGRDAGRCQCLRHDQARRRDADPHVSWRIRDLGLDGADFLGVRAAGHQRPADSAGRSRPICCARCRGSRSARAGRISPRASPMWRMPPTDCSPPRPRRSCDSDLSSRPRRELYRRAGRRRGAQRGAGRRDRACTRHRPWTRYTACVVRWRASDCAPTRAIAGAHARGRHRAPMRTGCVRTRNCGGASRHADGRAERGRDKSGHDE